MIVYAESSAVLAWLLGESGGLGVQRVLAGARAVVASRLTIAECERTLARLEGTRTVAPADVTSMRLSLARAVSAWFTLEMGDDVLERVGTVFPREPLRTLDAIHLSSAIECRTAEPGVVVLSLDQRIRDNAQGLGFEVQP